MREIDLETWPRRVHFEVFKTMQYPYFNLTANVDITLFKPALKQHGATFSTGIMYLISRVANGIPEFRTRIRTEKVIEHEVVHPSTTILTKEDLFSYCSVPYSPDFTVFQEEAERRFAEVRANPELSDGDWADTLLYMTSIPWVSFTSIMHPISLSPTDSVPRFAWGKYLEEGERIKMPLSVHGHHGLMDGVHVGCFFERFQALLDAPEEYLG
jgi:chloramphenicol O-acetyltransferase type A